MRTPLPKTSQFGSQTSNANHSTNGINKSASSLSNTVRKKPDYCWSFNKGIKCKFGCSCHFIECCSYCDSGAHGVISCPKLGHKEEERVNGGVDHKKSKQDKSSKN